MSNDQGSSDRLAELEARVRLLEDHAAVQRLVASWGPAVDICDAETAAALFAEEAVLESDLSYLTGPAEIAAMVGSDGQHELVREGSAHVAALPVVTIDGDRARATGYTRVYRHTPEGYEVWRVSANHWEFRRTSEGWRVTRRTNHLIDGGPEAAQLLGRAGDSAGRDPARP